MVGRPRRSATIRSLAVALPAGALLLTAPGISGCSAHRRTETTTETIEIPAGATLPDGRVAERDAPVTITRETTTVTEQESGCDGILGCTAKVAWEGVKLPFRIVGSILDLVF